MDVGHAGGKFFHLSVLNRYAMQVRSKRSSHWSSTNCNFSAGLRSKTDANSMAMIPLQFCSPGPNATKTAWGESESATQ